MLDRFDDPTPPRATDEVAAQVQRRGRGLRRRRRAFRGTLFALTGVVVVAGVLQAAGSGAQRVETVEPADAAYCAALSAPLQPPSDRSNFDVIVWVAPTVSAERVAVMKAHLESDARVELPVDLTDQQEAYEEFERMFPTSPESLSSVSPEILPYTFAVDVAVGVDPHALAADYGEMPGVKAVTLPADTRSLRVVDAVLLPLLGDENLHFGPSFEEAFTFAPGAMGRLDRAEAAAPSPIEADVASLAGAVRADATFPGDEVGSTRDPSLQGAADRVRADARQRCSIEVRLADGSPLPPGS
jgi:hypothetical protein